MRLSFNKYQGAGNDFVLTLVEDESLTLNSEQISFICNRKFGIGADGYIEIYKNRTADFEMKYYNADGKIGSMCGNGARCAVAFSKRSGLIENDTRFVAYDGIHTARILNNGNVVVSICDVGKIEEEHDFFFVDTGSPHHIQFVTGLSEFPVEVEGYRIRHSERYKCGGTNVNFVEIRDQVANIRTYERGVEGETLACGTGVTAVALVILFKNFISGLENQVRVNTLGGELVVTAKKNKDQSFSSIQLEGPAEFVFSGEIEL